MVDTNANKPEIRSQIAFIGREVATLEADYVHLGEAHAQFKQSADKTITDLQVKNQALIAENEKLVNPTPKPPMFGGQPRIKGRMEL